MSQEEKKIKFCTLVAAIVAVAASSVLVFISYLAVQGIHSTDVWHAADYWLAWFSGFSLVGGTATGIIAVVQGCIFFDSCCYR